MRHVPEWRLTELTWKGRPLARMTGAGGSIAAKRVTVGVSPSSIVPGGKLELEREMTDAGGESPRGEVVMASAELLRKLFQTYHRRDDQGFLHVAERLIAEERAKHHNLLADELAQILNGGEPGRAFAGTLGHGLEALPKDRERDTLLLEIRRPDVSLTDAVLSEDNRTALLDIIREYRHGEILRANGLHPRTHLLFCGPPGCGKTLSASVIASELGLPLLYARFDAIVSSYLGETAANLRKVFDYASRGMWVLLFDEVDAIGKRRDNYSEHGELKRVVNTFLQLLDGFRGESLVIAATNHEALLDNALWRRFDEVLLFLPPTREQICHLLDVKLRGFRHAGVALKTFADDLDGLSHADIERICHDAMRDCLLGGSDTLREEHFMRAIARQQKRSEVVEGAQREKRAHEEIGR